MHLRGGEEDQILATLETDLGGSWEGVATNTHQPPAPPTTQPPPPRPTTALQGNCTPVLTEETVFPRLQGWGLEHYKDVLTGE